MAQLLTLTKTAAGVVQGTALTLPAGTVVDGASPTSALTVPAWSSTTTYTGAADSGQLCTYQGAIYRSLQNANLNKIPTAEVTYWLCVVAAGTAGIDGDAGIDGADGGDFHVHEYAPTGSDGNNGDLWHYIHTAVGTVDVYYKITGTWVLQYSLPIITGATYNPFDAIVTTGLTAGLVYRRQEAPYTPEWVVADPDDAICETCELWLAISTTVLIAEGTYAAAISGAVQGDPGYLADAGGITHTVPNSPTDDGRVGRIVAWQRAGTSLRFDGHIPGGIFAVTGS